MRHARERYHLALGLRFAPLHRWSPQGLISILPLRAFVPAVCQKPHLSDSRPPRTGCVHSKPALQMSRTGTAGTVLNVVSGTEPVPAPVSVPLTCALRHHKMRPAQFVKFRDSWHDLLCG